MDSIKQSAARGITVWAQDAKTEFEIGINRSGELFLGNSKCGYNLRDSHENRARVQSDFKRTTGIDASIPDYDGPDDPTEPDEGSFWNW